MTAHAEAVQMARRSPAPALFDDDGFVAESARWDRGLAREIARLEGIADLGAKHWEIIDLVRQRYFTLGALPVMRLVCRAVQLDPLAAQRLFSSCRSLWRIAGLPNPGEEAKSYMH